MIRAAAQKSGRTETAVQLVGVTKYAEVTDDCYDALFAAGIRDFGEARPQRLLEKAEALRNRNIRWHLIGSLQRNKARKIIGVASLIHSIDSVRLAEAIDRMVTEEIASENLPPDTIVHALLEVAISDDETKQGFAPSEMPEIIETISRCKNLRIDGLMGMSGLESSDAERRKQFALLRETAEKLRGAGVPENIPLSELSMGMSDDFTMAIEEGATIVRIGSRLYV